MRVITGADIPLPDWNIMWLATVVWQGLPEGGRPPPRDSPEPDQVHRDSPTAGC